MHSFSTPSFIDKLQYAVRIYSESACACSGHKGIVRMLTLLFWFPSLWPFEDWAWCSLYVSVAFFESYIVSTLCFPSCSNHRRRRARSHCFCKAKPILHLAPCSMQIHEGYTWLHAWHTPWATSEVINGTDSPVWARESELEAAGGVGQLGQLGQLGQNDENHLN